MGRDAAHAGSFAVLMRSIHGERHGCLDAVTISNTYFISREDLDMFVPRCKRSSHRVTFVYVSDQSCVTASVIDWATNTFVAGVNADLEPLSSGVGLNEAYDRVYVANFGVDELGLGTVSVIRDDVTPQEAILNLVESVEEREFPKGIPTSLTSKLLSANMATWLAAY